MKRCLVLLLVTLAMLSFTGCGNKTVIISDDSYNYLTDATIAKNLPFPANVNIAKSENGYYALTGKKIYYIERSSMEAIPLCNKPNCTHQNETCNSYVGAVDNICYYDGDVYYVCPAEDEKGFVGSYLVKMSADGSTKEKLLYIETDINEWMLHRGHFYYDVRIFKVDESTGFTSVSNCDCYIYDYSLADGGEVQVMYYAEEVYKNAQISVLSAYGNYIYFELDGIERNGSNQVEKTIRLNINDKTCTNMVNENGNQLRRPNYIGGQLLFNVKGETYSYLTDFNGNNPKKFYELNGAPYCDGKYIYEDNMFDSTETERRIKVYDKDMNPIDEFSLDSSSAITWHFLPVDSEMFIFAGKNESGDLIFYFDKSEFGTINGGVWELKFAYKEALAEDSNLNAPCALSNSAPYGSDTLVSLWQKAKDKEYGVKDSFQSDGTEVEGGFSVRIMWEQDGGTFTAYFPFMEFENEDKAKEYINTNPYALQKGNIVVNIGVNSVPQEVYDMLSSILNGTPIEPIDSKDFSGENFTFK